MHLRKHIGGRREGDGEEGGGRRVERLQIVCVCMCTRACLRAKESDGQRVFELCNTN